jgi:enoyl-[acyl-carrier protein] reductase I
MPEGGTLLTLTYQGSNRVTPFYNVMGVAKAALESSVRYLANDLGPAGHPRERDLARADEDAGGRGHRRRAQDLQATTEANAPLRANATLEAVGGTAVYLASDYGACTTGEIITVDGGYHVWGCRRRPFPPREPDLAAADEGAVVAPGGGPPGPDILP